jgi:hypothetical protein
MDIYPDKMAKGMWCGKIAAQQGFPVRRPAVPMLLPVFVLAAVPNLANLPSARQRLKPESLGRSPKHSGQQSAVSSIDIPEPLC